MRARHGPLAALRSSRRRRAKCGAARRYPTTNNPVKPMSILRILRGLFDPASAVSKRKAHGAVVEVSQLTLRRLEDRRVLSATTLVDQATTVQSAPLFRIDPLHQPSTDVRERFETRAAGIEANAVAAKLQPLFTVQFVPDSGQMIGFEGIIFGGQIAVKDLPAVTAVEGIEWAIQSGVHRLASGVGSRVEFSAPNQGSYRLTVDVLATDGTTANGSFDFTVFNVAPTADVQTKPVQGGKATVTFNVYDPGSEDVVLTVRWDAQHVIPYTLSGTRTITVEYTYPFAPDPLNPTKIDVSYWLQDDQVSVGPAVVTLRVADELPLAQAPERLEPPQLIVEQPQVNTERLQLDTVPQTVTSTVDQGGGVREVAEESDRRVLLRIVSPVGQESVDYELPYEALADLPAFFAEKELPDGHYRVYLIQDDSERLVIDGYLRNARLVDLENEHEEHLDRPLTDEEILEQERRHDQEQHAAAAGEAELTVPQPRRESGDTAGTEPNLWNMSVLIAAAGLPLASVPVRNLGRRFWGPHKSKTLHRAA